MKPYPLSFDGIIAKANIAKYGVPPEWDMIESFMKSLGMNQYRFEMFYGIPYNTLTQVKNGTKTLPCHNWHIIYERIRPKYGAGFLSDHYPIKKKKEVKKQPKIKPQVVSVDIHSRLAEIK